MVLKTAGCYVVETLRLLCCCLPEIQIVYQLELQPAAAATRPHPRLVLDIVVHAPASHPRYGRPNPPDLGQDCWLATCQDWWTGVSHGAEAWLCHEHVCWRIVLLEDKHVSSNAADRWHAAASASATRLDSTVRWFQAWPQRKWGWCSRILILRPRSLRRYEQLTESGTRTLNRSIMLMSRCLVVNGTYARSLYEFTGNHTE